MSGNKVAGGGIGLAAWLCLALSLGSAACAEEVTISGRVHGEGVGVAGLVVEVLGKAGRLADGRVERDGRYRTAADVNADDGPVVVLVYNDGIENPKAGAFVFGEATVALPKGARRATADVEVRTMEKVARAAQITTKEGTRAGGIRVQCALLLGAEGPGRVPARRWAWSLEAEHDGRLELRVPADGDGALSLTANSLGEDGARYIGNMTTALRDLRGLPAEVALPWVVTRKPLSARVRFAWAPDFSEAPFRPEVGRYPLRHVAVVRGPREEKVIMDEEGGVSLYGLPVGEYVVDLTQESKGIYQVVGNHSFTVTQEGGVDGVASVDVHLRPVSVRSASGRVLDAESKEPVANAVVSGGGMLVKTAQDGRFVVKSCIPGQTQLTIRHPSYYPASVDTKAADEAGDIVIKPLSLVGGRILERATDDVVPYAIVELTPLGVPQPATRCIADAKGAYSIRVKPARYRVVVKRRHVPEGGISVGAKKPQEVRLYEGILSVPEGGVREDLEVGRMALASVTLGGDIPSAGRYDLVIALLTAADSRIAGTALADEKTHQADIAVQEGRYRVVVAHRGRNVAQFCGEAVVSAGDQPTEVSIRLSREWQAFDISGDGVVTVAVPATGTPTEPQ